MPDGCPSGQPFFGSAPPHGLAHTLTKGEEVTPMRMTLDALPVGASAVVTALRSTGAQRRRMLDLGFVPGSCSAPCTFPRGATRSLTVCRRGHRAAARGRGRRADRNAFDFSGGIAPCRTRRISLLWRETQRGKSTVFNALTGLRQHRATGRENRRAIFIRRRALHARRSAGDVLAVPQLRRGGDRAGLSLLRRGGGRAHFGGCDLSGAQPEPRAANARGGGRSLRSCA